MLKIARESLSPPKVNDWISPSSIYSKDNKGVGNYSKDSNENGINNKALKLTWNIPLARNIDDHRKENDGDD